MVKRDISEEFEWNATQLGYLDSIFSATYALGQIPSGILCDWFGPHVLLGSIMMLWSLSMGAVVLATGYGSVLAARGMFGLTQAGCYPTLSKVSKLWFPDDIRTTLQAWIATFFGRGGGAVALAIQRSVSLDLYALSTTSSPGMFWMSVDTVGSDAGRRTMAGHCRAASSPCILAEIDMFRLRALLIKLL